jgi:hypothetical protein
MDLKRRGVVALIAAGSMAGGAVGATVISAASSSAATTTTTTPAAPAGPGPGGQNGGTFRSNENPAHEKTESAQREAQENAGQRPTVP